MGEFEIPYLKRDILFSVFCIEEIINDHQVEENYWFQEFIKERLLYVAMQFLLEEKFIYYFDPAYYTRDAFYIQNLNICWVRY